MIYFHRGLGLLILFMFFYIMKNAENISPEFHKYAFPACELSRCRSPILYISIPPFLSAICFLFPGLLSLTFSPRTSMTGERIFTEGFYYFIAYLLLILTCFIFYIPLRDLF